MEVINVLPTPVAIIPCPFHSKVKETILAEIEEQKQNQITYSANSEQLKHIGHYSVLHNDERYGRFRNWCEQQAEIYAKVGINIPIIMLILICQQYTMLILIWQEIMCPHILPEILIL